MIGENFNLWTEKLIMNTSAQYAIMIRVGKTRINQAIALFSNKMFCVFQYS